MKISVSLKLESLLRELRLTGHALAESAEREALRAAQLGPKKPAAAAEVGREGGEA